MPAARRRSKSLLTVVALALVLFGVWWGGHPGDLPRFLRSALVAGQPNAAIDQAVSDVLDDYYRPIRRSQLVDSSLSALVASLHDRFSAYFTPAQFRAFNRSANQEFSGIGMQVIPVARGLLVRQVFDNSPASRAGITVGDTIVRAGGRRLAGQPDATGLIKGRPGTQVSLQILHRHRLRTVTVTRAIVSVPVVASRLVRYRGIKIAHVALATFSAGAHGDVRSAIDRLLGQGARGIVFDLRGNGGGLVDEARLVASIFVASGPIVTTRGRAQPTVTLTSAGAAIPGAIPVAVLVDGGTASAAEIVAGALQDRHRATVVGTRTFGKGVFQEVTPLDNGGALDITVGEYFLPSGRNLGGGGIKRGSGITPDVVVKRPPTVHSDPALRAALRIVAAKLR
jgi:carboxyl-terminal processing protease